MDMRKKIVLIGVLLLIFGFVMTFVIVPNPKVITPPVYNKTTSILPGSFTYINFTLTNDTQVFLLAANFTHPINVFVFNHGAFALWEANAASSNAVNPFAYAQSLEGRGTLDIYRNVSNFAISGKSMLSDGNTIYSSANSTLASDGKDYAFVFQNSNGNVTNPGSTKALVSYIPPLSIATIKASSKLSNYFYFAGSLEFVFFVVFLAGIVIAIYGLLKKPKPSPDAVPKAGSKLDQAIKERDQLYKAIDKGKRKSRK